jgi:hypothetical protein
LTSNEYQPIAKPRTLGDIMKSLLTLAILFICSIAISQENGIYTDTVNKFSIGVPSGWQIRKGLSENSSTLSVFLPKMQGHGFFRLMMLISLEFQIQVLKRHLPCFGKDTFCQRIQSKMRGERH